MAAMAAMAIGAALEFGGGMMNRNAGIALKDLRRRGRHSIAKARASDALFGGLQESALRTAHAKELQGLQGAKRTMGLAGEQAKLMARERGAQNQAQAEQSIVGRGLAGTSTGAQVFTGVADQTSRHLSSIDMQLAQQLSDLGLAQAETEGQQGREIAALRAKDRAFNQEMEEFYASIMTGGAITK